MASELDLASENVPRASDADYFLPYLCYGRVHRNGDECVQRLFRILTLYGGPNCDGLGSFEHGDVELSGSDKQGRRRNRTNCSFELLSSVLDLGYTSCLYFQDDQTRTVRDLNLAATAYQVPLDCTGNACDSNCYGVLHSLQHALESKECPVFHCNLYWLSSFLVHCAS